MIDLSYFEETVPVLVIEAEYDEEGVEITPAVYGEVTTIKPRTETKTLADVRRVVNKHAGKKPTVVDKFIEKYLAGIQWDWLEVYQAYEEDLAEVEAWNEEFAGQFSHTEIVHSFDDDGNDVYTHIDISIPAKELPEAPIRPAEQTVEDWKTQDTETASVDREAAMLVGVEFEEVMCSATAEDMWGLGSIVDWIKLGNTTNFKFSNGNTLELTSDNIDSFQMTWTPFRATFF